MTEDRQKFHRLALMINQAKDALEMEDPDLRVVEKLLADALNLACALNEPPNPYADPALRPGLHAEADLPLEGDKDG